MALSTRFAMRLAVKWHIGFRIISRIGYVVSLIADVMFVAGLFVQGGDFWDKLRAPYFLAPERRSTANNDPDYKGGEKCRTRQRIKPSSSASAYN